MTTQTTNDAFEKWMKPWAEKHEKEYGYFPVAKDHLLEVWEAAKEAGYLEGVKIASVIAHEYGRRVYGPGGNKVREAMHELGKELDKNVQY